MSEKIGHVALENDRRGFLSNGQQAGPVERNYSEETARAIDEEVRRIVDETFKMTMALLEERRDMLEKTSRLLLDRETLDEKDLQELTGSGLHVRGEMRT